MPTVDQPTTPASTVLLVEEDHRVRRALASMLRQDGLQVLEADCGALCLEELTRRQAAIDLVLLDLDMPGLDGGTTLRRLRSAGHRVPVILNSAGRHHDCLHCLLDLPPVAYLPKPFHRTELLTAMSPWLPPIGALGLL